MDIPPSEPLFSMIAGYYCADTGNLCEFRLI